MLVRFLHGTISSSQEASLLIEGIDFKKMAFRSFLIRPRSPLLVFPFVLEGKLVAAASRSIAKYGVGGLATTKLVLHVSSPLPTALV